MCQDVSTAQVYKLPETKKQRLMLVSPVISWESHWLDRRSHLCPRDKCPACKAWLPSFRQGALAITSFAEPPVWLQTNANDFIGTAGCGTIVEVAQRKRGQRITPLGDGEPRDVYDSWHAWSVLAKMNRLPLPMTDDITEALDVMRAAARRRLKEMLPIISAETGEA